MGVDVRGSRRAGRAECDRRGVLTVDLSADDWYWGAPLAWRLRTPSVCVPARQRRGRAPSREYFRERLDPGCRVADGGSAGSGVAGRCLGPAEMTDAELAGAAEFVRDRVYYVALRGRPRERADAHFFSTDDTLVYWNFFLDFGPLNLGQLYRFCQMLNNKLRDKSLSGKRIYYYSGTHGHRRANSAFMMCAYAIIYLGRTPEEAYRPFQGVYPPFPPFHDASPCVCTYNLTVLDVLRGMYKAMKLGYFNFDTFDVEEYEHFEKVECGDLNWLAEGKFLAFAGPHEHRSVTPEGYHTLCPDDYIPYFKKKNVTLVVRLNKKYYNERRFKDAGIDHLDLYYLDGSNPPDHILQRFIEACENTPGAVAVHCKAGLGRTGTCIGAYMQKHDRFTAAEVIGWIRLCRPGSIIGPQQHYMKEIEQKMWTAGDAYRKRHGIAARGDERGRREVGAVDGMLDSLAIEAGGRRGGRTSGGAGGAGGAGGSRDRERERDAEDGGRSRGSGLRSAGYGVATRGGSTTPTNTSSKKGLKGFSSSPGSGGAGGSSLRSPLRSGAASSLRSPALSSPGGASVASDTSQGDQLRAARLKSPGAYRSSPGGTSSPGLRPSGSSKLRSPLRR